MKPSVTLKDLCKQLNYQFQDISLLERALTHRSYGDKNNERLEFLGDAVLNFCIAEKLFHQYPAYKEGDLSRSRSNLVNGEILAVLATEFNISCYLKMGAGELKSGGLERKSTLADTMEAIIGAIYLDGGADVCREQIAGWFSKAFVTKASRGHQKDPKSQLQEYLQAQKIALPVYALLSITGKENEQLFQVSCSISGLPHTIQGSGTSRKYAEQDAAAKILKLLKVPKQ
jgi:ribonuclease-3